MQKGHIVKISDRWYVRYWEGRSIGGIVKQKRVSFCLGAITTRGKHPPADVKDAAAEHMAVLTAAQFPQSGSLPSVSLSLAYLCSGSSGTSDHQRRSAIAISGRIISRASAPMRG